VLFLKNTRCKRRLPPNHLTYNHHHHLALSPAEPALPPIQSILHLLCNHTHPLLIPQSQSLSSSSAFRCAPGYSTNFSRAFSTTRSARHHPPAHSSPPTPTSHHRPHIGLLSARLSPTLGTIFLLLLVGNVWYMGFLLRVVIWHGLPP